MQLLARELSAALGVRIDRWAAVDLDAFSSVTVTALQKPGKTELTVEPPEAALPE